MIKPVQNTVRSTRSKWPECRCKKRHPVHSHHAYPNHSTGHFVVGLLLGAQILDPLHALLLLGCSSIFLFLPLHWLRVTKRFSLSLCTFCSLPSAADWALLPAVGYAFLPLAVGSALPCLLLAVPRSFCCGSFSVFQRHFVAVHRSVVASNTTTWQFVIVGSRHVLSVQGRIVTTSRSAGSVRLVLVACLRAAVSLRSGLWILVGSMC